MKQAISRGMLAAALAVASVTVSLAQDARPAGTEELKPANWLFVQVADSVVVGKDTLTLNGVAPQTLMFADRPERMTGEGTTAGFVKFWTEGKDSFQKDPPNATLSVTVDGKPVTTVVELSDPVIDGDSITYTFKSLSEEAPQSGTSASLFIDWWYGRGPYWGRGFCWRGPYGGLHCRAGW